MTRYELDPDRSTVRIDGTSSVHPITSEATGLEGWLEVAMRKDGAIAARPAVSGEIRIEVDRLKSGNGLIDRETRRRIDAKRHPEIVGTVTGGTRVDDHRLALDGVIEFRGESVEVSGEVVLDLGDDGELHVTGDQSFDVRDWDLQPPRVALLKVHPDVTVTIDLTATA